VRVAARPPPRCCSPTYRVLSSSAGSPSSAGPQLTVPASERHGHPRSRRRGTHPEPARGRPHASRRSETPRSPGCPRALRNGCRSQIPRTDSFRTLLAATPVTIAPPRWSPRTLSLRGLSGESSPAPATGDPERRFPSTHRGHDVGAGRLARGVRPLHLRQRAAMPPGTGQSPIATRAVPSCPS